MSTKPEIWQCPQCGEKLDISALGFYAQVDCPACGQSEYVHTMLSNFRVEGVVGIGGMSIVLRARDLVLNRCVAIKVLNDAYRNQPDRISRFENECAMMAKVRHDNVVSVYSAGRARKQFYIVMELVDGCDLDTMVTRDGPLTPEQAIEYTIQIVKGLEAAHHSGLLHRDMKPGNVIITPEGRAKVLDFGLALGQKDEDTEEIIWATPYYVPPETLERKDEDARTDIYALGMTLRYLLTGNETFKESASSVSELLQNKFKLPPFATVLPGTDESLCDLVDHMTAFDPARRPLTYRDLLAELRAVKQAMAESKEEKSPENQRKARRAFVVESAVTAVLGIAALAVGIMLGTPADERELVAVKRGSYAWSSMKTLSEAEAALQQAKYDEAGQKFASLASEDAEPAMAAWASLHAALLAEIKKNTDAREAALEDFRYQLTRKNAVAPAAADLLEQLSHVEKALRGDGSGIEKISNQQVKALASIWLARYLIADSRLDEGRAAIQQAEKASTAAGEPYSVLADEFSRMAMSWAPENYIVLYEQAKDAMLQHNMAEARHKLQELLKERSLAEERANEARVLLEVCEVSTAMFDMLKRRCPRVYTPGCSPDKVAEAAGYLNKGKLADELRVLCLMLATKYREAFDRNPYKDNDTDTEPFAVMVRDWKKRLGR